MARTGLYIRWSEKEDWWCVNRFIKNYFENLIEFNQRINSKDMTSEVDLYRYTFSSLRTRDSIKMKFHNIEYLAYDYANKKMGKNYKLKGLEHCSKQSIEIWETQIKNYENNINKNKS